MINTNPRARYTPELSSVNVDTLNTDESERYTLPFSRKTSFRTQYQPNVNV